MPKLLALMKPLVLFLRFFHHLLHHNPVTLNILLQGRPIYFQRAFKYFFPLDL